jgi:hypothetical protein
MKKAGLVLLVLVILGSWAVKDSEAGQWCWQFAAYPDDYMKLSVTKPDPLYPFWSLHGMWYNSLSPYIIPLVGSMVKSADGTQRLLTLEGTYPGGTLNFAINAQIDAVTKNGTFHIYYIEQTGDSLGSFPLNKVKCSTLPAP